MSNILESIEEASDVFALYDKQAQCSIFFTKREGVCVATIGAAIDADTTNEMVIKLGRIFNWDLEFMADVLKEMKEKLGE